MVELFASTSERLLGNRIIFAFEILALIISVLMITVGMIQNKTSQTGLSALNGGNDELFSNSKERGLDKTLSIWMFSLGIIIFVSTIVIGIITNVLLAEAAAS
ncbi:preprotein translocase subunit SecG [Spiroplasma gladiatoris]|uniref:Protein-export membrane protein SecG n=1 Tax=Spiroplasma gladiatoris TaxID=2143 RepID=A0A4P7AIH3_9MOLU|nr:preprotein translocase subunit SecG [Spiroplasma gladiatoris]QBQ07300.1 preprotein translocase subunit SecG [Spiroplasma gladiatoris]